MSMFTRTASQKLLAPLGLRGLALGLAIDSKDATIKPLDTSTGGPVSIPGAVAEVTDSASSRVTATRLVALGVFALAARKRTGEVHILITAASGEQTLAVCGAKHVKDARVWAVAFNNAARQLAAAAGAE